MRFAAGAVDEVVATPLGGRPRVDDRSTRGHLLLVDPLGRHLLRLPIPGIIPSRFSSGPILPDGPDLVAEVLQCELALPELLFQLLRLVHVDGLLGLLDERQHVAHPEHARDDPIGVERLEVCRRSPLPANAIGTPTTETDRTARAAARVTVHLLKHDAGHADPAG